MKTITTLLITILYLQVQGQTVDSSKFTIGDTVYAPRVNYNGSIAYSQQGYATILPRNYSASKTYPVIMLIHGNGERSMGRLGDLRNVVQGFDYNGDGYRDAAITTDDFKTAINTYQFIGVVPTYGGDFNPVDINYVLDQVEKDYTVDKSREAIVGFSRGGGSVLRYITSSQANADRLALAVPIAPIAWATTLTYIVNSKLPVVAATNRTDNIVSPKIVNDFTAAVNALNPDFPVKLITFAKDGHGGFSEMQSLYHAQVPQSVYPYLLAITKDSPKAYPTGGTTTIPPPVIQPPTTTLTAVAKDIGITSTAAIKLDGTASKGWLGATWGTISVPAGVNIYSKIITGGAGWIQGTAMLPKEGAYTFVLNTYTATQSAKDTIVVTYQKTTVPIPVKPLLYDAGYLVFSDGSRVKATVTSVDFVAKKTIVTDEAGIIYPVQ